MLAVFSVFRTRQSTDCVNNFWQAPAEESALLNSTRERAQVVTVPDELGALVKEPMSIAVSAVNGFSHFVRSHISATRVEGVTDGQLHRTSLLDERGDGAGSNDKG